VKNTKLNIKNLYFKYIKVPNFQYYHQKNIIFNKINNSEKIMVYSILKNTVVREPKQVKK